MNYDFQDAPAMTPILTPDDYRLLPPDLADRLAIQSDWAMVSRILERSMPQPRQPRKLNRCPFESGSGLHPE